jgi:hypothetical protein
MQVIPLRFSQFHYHVRTACSYTHLYLCHYMLFSNSRIGPHGSTAQEAIEHWIRLACFQFHQDRPARHFEREEEAFLTPLEAFQVSEFLLQGALKYCEEISGTTQPQAAKVQPVASTHEQLQAHLVQNPETLVQGLRSATAQFLEEGALVPLWRALRRMFYFALSRPMAATYTSHTQQICCIGMRWKEGVLEQTKGLLRKQFYMLGDHAAETGAMRGCPDDYDLSDKPSLRMLDSFPAIASDFYLDFFDTHSNSPTTGLPVPLEEGGTAVWIRFSSLTVLCQYLMQRYGKEGGRFDLALWQYPDSPDGSILLTQEQAESCEHAALKVIDSYAYRHFVSQAENRH